MQKIRIICIYFFLSLSVSPYRQCLHRYLSIKSPLSIFRICFLYMSVSLSFSLSLPFSLPHSPHSPPPLLSCFWSPLLSFALPLIIWLSSACLAFSPSLSSSALFSYFFLLRLSLILADINHDNWLERWKGFKHCRHGYQYVTLSSLSAIKWLFYSFL